MCNYAIRYDHDILSKLYSDQIWINYRQIIFLMSIFVDIAIQNELLEMYTQLVYFLLLYHLKTFVRYL